MSDLRSAIEIKLDVENKVQRNLVVQGELATHPSFSAMDQLIIRAHLYRLNGTYFTPPTDCTWDFIVGSDVGSSATVVAFSGNDQFNQSDDWDELDVINGKICWRVALNTTQMRDQLGNSVVLPVYCNLWMTPVDGDSVIVGQFQANVYNTVTDPSTLHDLQYINTGMLIFEGSDIVLKFPDGVVAERWVKQ